MEIRDVPSCPGEEGAHLSLPHGGSWKRGAVGRGPAHHQQGDEAGHEASVGRKYLLAGPVGSGAMYAGGFLQAEVSQAVERREQLVNLVRPSRDWIMGFEEGESSSSGGDVVENESGDLQEKKLEGVKADEMAEDDGRVPRVMKTPVKPSQSEMDDHLATHIPYRSWCPHCVRGRGVNLPHYACSRDRTEDQVPTIHADYMFLSNVTAKKAGEKGLAPVLVMRDGSSGATMSMLVPKKGPSTAWVNQRSADWINGLGYGRVILKTDQEPTIYPPIKKNNYLSLPDSISAERISDRSD